MDLYNLDIPGGSEWNTYMVDAWISLFLTLFFIFISFRSLPLPKLTPPVEYATGPRLFFFFIILPLSPFPTGLSKDLADYFQFYLLWPGDTRLMFFF